jgi:hypothetical protein
MAELSTPVTRTSIWAGGRTQDNKTVRRVDAEIIKARTLIVDGDVIIDGGGIVGGSSISDADGDTRVDTEATADSDTIVMRVGDNAGTHDVSGPVMQLSKTGVQIAVRGGAVGQSTPGGSVTMLAGSASSDSTVAGGSLLFGTGAGGADPATSTGGNAGGVFFVCSQGAFDGDGGSFRVTTGSVVVPVFDGSKNGGDGGNVDFFTGDGGNSTQAGAARSGGDGGSYSITLGEGGNGDDTAANGGGQGGSFILTTGEGGRPSGDAGDIRFFLSDAGTVGTADARAGSFLVECGENFNAGRGGAIVFHAGDIPFNGAVTDLDDYDLNDLRQPLPAEDERVPGTIVIRAGSRTSGVGTSPGTVRGGDVRIYGGFGAGNAPGAVARGGHVYIQGGATNGGAGGDAVLCGGTARTGTANGGVTGRAIVQGPRAPIPTWSCGAVCLWGADYLHAAGLHTPGAAFVWGGQGGPNCDGGGVWVSSGTCGTADKRTGDLLLTTASPGIDRETFDAAEVGALPLPTLAGATSGAIYLASGDVESSIGPASSGPVTVKTGDNLIVAGNGVTGDLVVRTGDLSGGVGATGLLQLGTGSYTGVGGNARNEGYVSCDRNLFSIDPARPALRNTTVTDFADAVDPTYTALHILGGIIGHAPSVPRAATLPDGVDILNEINRPFAGMTFTFSVFNDGVDTVTLTSGANGTDVFSPAVQPQTAATFAVRITNIFVNAYDLIRTA